MARGITSLETGDRSGYLYTSGKKAREERKGKEEQESKKSCGNEENAFSPVQDHIVG